MGRQSSLWLPTPPPTPPKLNVERCASEEALANFSLEIRISKFRRLGIEHHNIELGGTGGIKTNSSQFVNSTCDFFPTPVDFSSFVASSLSAGQSLGTIIHLKTDGFAMTIGNDSSTGEEKWRAGRCLKTTSRRFLHWKLLAWSIGAWRCLKITIREAEKLGWAMSEK